MSILRQQGNELMSWTFLKTTRARQEWWDHGDKFTTLGLFDFLVSDNTGRITGTVPQADLDRIARWPHTRYLLTVRNDGVFSRFKAIVDNTGGAQDMFVSELHRILDARPYAAGVDIDLEIGPADNPDGVVALAKRIFESIKARSSQRFVHWDLPPMTGDGAPYWERWCDYRRLEPYFDSCAIMSYAFAWAGSAPGPISPMWWLEQVYDYAVTRIPREKIHLGIVGFGFNWRIDREPTGYRGASGTFLAFLGWQQGDFNHHAAQPLVPFAGYHDHESQSPYLMLHVYDKLEGADTTNTLAPAQRVSGAVGNTKRNYLVTYGKSPAYDFQGIMVDRGGTSYDEISGAMSEGVGWVSPRARRLVGTPPVLEEEGLVTYTFNVPSAGTYQLI
ncbi:MAG: glycosyl hydrolase family 18 protein, partial [bacterium]|nr:glycosyl hydrolase family 18 protein [bacterium]